MKNGNGHSKKKDDFIAPARRAFRRVARQVREENSRLGLPLILGDKNHARLSNAR